MDFMKEIKEYLIDKIKNIGFDVSPERANQIIEKVMSFADDPYGLAFHDEKDRFIKINDKINEELNILIDYNKEKIREERARETTGQKLDKIDDHLVELIRILREKK